MKHIGFNAPSKSALVNDLNITEAPAFAPQTLKPWTHPDSYVGAKWEGYYGAGVGQHRDSDVLAQSNFACMKAALDKLPAWERKDDEAPESRLVVREKHWAVGWVEWIAIHETDVEALKEADRIATGLEDYPVIDEMDLSEREIEAANQTWKDCYRVGERIKYIREHRGQFEFTSLADMLGCVRGNYFAGYASELLS